MPVADPSLHARHLVVGPPGHGVVMHATRLAAADEELRAATVVVPAFASGETPPGLDAAVPEGATALLHVTDRLFGASPEEAAGVIRGLADRAALVLSLHDVPQAAEGADWYARRRQAYADIALTATRLVVASESEADLLAACLSPADRPVVARRTTVIPLPVERREPAVGPPETRQGRDGRGVVELGILGFLYPGKGVEDAIDIAAALSAPDRLVTVTNHGATAEGHADHAESLARYAAAAGVGFRVTGYLSDADLHAAVLAADVPLAPHRHISASGSLNTWIESGRRPLVRRSPYVTELERRLPGVLTPVDDLTTAVAAALADPGSTWAVDGSAIGPSWSTAAAAHVTVLHEIS